MGDGEGDSEVFVKLFEGWISITFVIMVTALYCIAGPIGRRLTGKRRTNICLSTGEGGTTRQDGVPVLQRGSIAFCESHARRT